MTKKLTLIACLFMISTSYAEQMICKIEGTDSRKGVEKEVQDCKAGNILMWRKLPTNISMSLIAKYCHQEKQITVTGDFTYGVCTYTGKKLVEQN